MILYLKITLLLLIFHYFIAYIAYVCSANIHVLVINIAQKPVHSTILMHCIITSYGCQMLLEDLTSNRSRRRTAEKDASMRSYPTWMDRIHVSFQWFNCQAVSRALQTLWTIREETRQQQYKILLLWVTSELTKFYARSSTMSRAERILASIIFNLFI